MSTENTDPTTAVTQPMDNAPQTPAPIEAGGGAPDQRAEFFSRAKDELGIDVKDEADIFAYVRQVQGDRDKHMREYEAVSKKLPPALKEIADMLESEGFKGSDEDLATRAYQYLGDNLRKYPELAESSPEAVIRDHLKSSNSAYSDSDIDQLIARKRKTFMAEAVNEGLEDDKAEAYVKAQMSLEAKGFVPSLEARKAQLRFKPAAIQQETPEQVAAKEKQVAEANINSTWSAIRSFKGLDLGEAGEWEVPFLESDGKIRPDMLPMLNEIASPGAWFQKFLNPDGSENKAMMLEYESFRRFAAQAAAKRTEDAHGDGARTVLNKLHNPSLATAQQGAPAESGQMTSRDFVSRKPIPLR